MIDDLIRTGAAQTGLSDTQVRSALSGALGLIDKHAAPAKRDELYAAVPGAQALAAQGAAAAPKGGGGLMGGLMRAAGGSGGGAMADAMAMLERAKREGISQDELKRLLPVAMDWVRSQTGRDLLREVVQTVPGVGGMLGGR